MANILIIDDSNVYAQTHAKILEKQGHDITFAENGEIGIEKAHADKPDLILMDLIMPGKLMQLHMHILKPKKQNKTFDIENHPDAFEEINYWEIGGIPTKKLMNVKA